MQDHELRGLDRACFHVDTVTQERTFLFRGPPQPRLQYHKHVITCLRGFLAVQQWKRDAEFSRQVNAVQNQHSVKTSAKNNKTMNEEHHSDHEMEKNSPKPGLLSPITKPTASASKRLVLRQRNKVDKGTPRATRERQAKKKLSFDVNINPEDKNEEQIEKQDSQGEMSEGHSQIKLVKVLTS